MVLHKIIKDPLKLHEYVYNFFKIHVYITIKFIKRAYDSFENNLIMPPSFFRFREKMIAYFLSRLQNW